MFALSYHVCSPSLIPLPCLVWWAELLGPSANAPAPLCPACVCVRLWCRCGGRASEPRGVLRGPAEHGCGWRLAFEARGVRTGQAGPSGDRSVRGLQCWGSRCAEGGSVWLIRLLVCGCDWQAWQRGPVTKAVLDRMAPRQKAAQVAAVQEDPTSLSQWREWWASKVWWGAVCQEQLLRWQVGSWK